MAWFKEIYDALRQLISITGEDGKPKSIKIQTVDDINNLTPEEARLVIKEIFPAIKTNLEKLPTWPSATGTLGKVAPYAGTLIKLKGGGPLLDKVLSLGNNDSDKLLTWLSGSEGRRIIAKWDEFKNMPKGPTDTFACPVLVALFKKAIS